MSPLAEEKYLSVEAFERDCRRVSELTGGRIEEISLLGGEPLLHTQIIDFTSIARKYYCRGRIQIVTNGVLLLKQPELFWEALKKNNIRLCITVYPVKIDYEKISRLGKRYKVEIIYWGSLKDKKKVWENADRRGRRTKRRGKF